MTLVADDEKYLSAGCTECSELIAGSLIALTKLQWLNLSSTGLCFCCFEDVWRFSMEGVVLFFCDSVCSWRVLFVMRDADMRMGRKGGKLLAESLRLMTELQFLDLEGTALCFCFRVDGCGSC